MEYGREEIRVKPASSSFESRYKTAGPEPVSKTPRAQKGSIFVRVEVMDRALLGKWEGIHSIPSSPIANQAAGTGAIIVTAALVTGAQKVRLRACRAAARRRQSSLAGPKETVEP